MWVRAGTNSGTENQELSESGIGTDSWGRDGTGTGYRPVRSGPVPVWISDRPVVGRPVVTGRPAGRL
jgi:hypothetical protein